MPNNDPYTTVQGRDAPQGNPHEDQYSAEMQRRRAEAQARMDAGLGAGPGGSRDLPGYLQDNAEGAMNRLYEGGDREMMDRYWQNEQASAGALRQGYESGESSVAMHQARIAQGQAAQQMSAAGRNPLAARAAQGNYQQQAVNIAGQGGMGRADEMNQARMAQLETLGRRGEYEMGMQEYDQQRRLADLQRKAAEEQAKRIRDTADDAESTANENAVIGAATGFMSAGGKFAKSDSRLKHSIMRGLNR